MKEVKEVVHVPTKELAEEVLRVAKENGLYKDYDLESMLKQVKQDELYIRPGLGLDFGFSGFSYYKDKECKVITAQEFLNRYKPKFRPIAMRCNQEQFDAVKGKLVGCRIEDITEFESCNYLVNNYGNHTLVITNTRAVNKSNNNRQVFEEWNEKTFLEYCGIEVKDEVNELEQLRKENAELKQQLKAIEDQPKVGDVCLFWDEGASHYGLGILHKVSIVSDKNLYFMEDIDYTNCIKATPENIQSKIEELKND